MGDSGDTCKVASEGNKFCSTQDTATMMLGIPSDRFSFQTAALLALYTSTHGSTDKVVLLLIQMVILLIDGLCTKVQMVHVTAVHKILMLQVRLWFGQLFKN